MNSPYFQRAMILQQQHRHADAANELRKVLAEDPHDAMAHALLAMSLVEQDKLKDATAEAQQAVALAPDMALAHFALGYALMKRNWLDEAKAAAAEATRLDSFDPNHFALMSAIEFHRRNWPGALEQAENGLALDAEHSWSTNLRAMALVQLGRRDEASATTRQALARDPEDAFSHANEGWTCLHRGDHKQAMVHFREALRLDPNLQWAKSGMLEALKSGFWPYRILLKFFLWMERLGGRAQFGVIFGGWLGYQVLRSVARQYPNFGKFVWPLLLAYIVFCIMTWLAGPLLNLALRLHRFGRYALTPDQKLASNCIGALLGVSILAMAGFVLWNIGPLLTLSVASFILIMPTAATFTCPRGWPRWTMIAAVAALTCVGAAIVALDVAERAGKLDEAMSKTVISVFVVGILLATFGSHALRMSRPRN